VPIYNGNARSVVFIFVLIVVKAIPTKQAGSYSRFLRGGLTNHPCRQSISDHNLIHGVAKYVYVHGHILTSRFVRFYTTVRGLVKHTSRWGDIKQIRQGGCPDSDGELLLKGASCVWHCLINAKGVLSAPKIHMQQYALWFSFRHSVIQVETILLTPELLVVDNSARGPPTRM
jgi:hypothetical protein